MDKLACEVCKFRQIIELITSVIFCKKDNSNIYIIFVFQVDIFRQKCMELESKNASLVAQVKSMESQLAIGSTSSSPSDD